MFGSGFWLLASGRGEPPTPAEPSISMAYFTNPTHSDSAWRMPISAMTTATFGSAPEMASSAYNPPNPTFGFWEALNCPVYDGTGGKLVNVYYDFDTWANMFSDTWQPYGNSGAVETAIRASYSSTFTGTAHQYVTTVADGSETQTLPASFDPRTNPATPPRQIWVPTDTASLVTGEGTDSVFCCWQPDGTVFESYATIILANGDIVCWTYKITDPSLGGDGWQNGTRASMIPVYAGCIRKHEFDAAIAAGAMAEGPAKEAALEAAIPHAIAVYAGTTVLSNSVQHPAVTVDRGALTESPAYSGSQPMGCRYALPASTDVTGEGGAINLWYPFTRAIAYASKKYGWIVVDRSGGGTVLVTEPSIGPEYTYEWGKMADLFEIRNRLQKVTGITGPFVSPGA